MHVLWWGVAVEKKKTKQKQEHFSGNIEITVKNC